MSRAVGAASGDWREVLTLRADEPPRRARAPLSASERGEPAEARVVGSVEPAWIEGFLALRLADGTPLVSELGVSGYRVNGPATASLNLLAHEMRARGLSGPWRDEQLAVTDGEGRRVGTIERGAVRPLAISTHAVHLVGHAADGRVWVQQRALDKANDPGLWDTLMGGMVPAGDSLAQALARETWEEAGLEVEQLANLRLEGRVSLRLPCDDGGGAGYVIEHIDWYRATLPEGRVPVNQDGEVAQFKLLSGPEVLLSVIDGDYTLEASLILAEALSPPA